MKVWVGHGSEHSSRLILVGHFRDAATARQTEQQIKALDELAANQPEPDWEQREEWYDEETRDALNGMKLWQISPADLENFRYEHGLAREGSRVEISTEEYDIQGLIKVLVLAGARIEVYSHRQWNADGTPIPREEEGGGEAQHDDAEAGS